MIEIKEILSILPHAYPFLLVDRIIEIELEKRIVGIKNVTYNEPFFPGHFPGRPIMPGVLIVEAMAQTAGVLALPYPQGVGPEQMTDALAVVRIVDKLFRIAKDRDALGESPYRDIAGYGILGAHRVESGR